MSFFQRANLNFHQKIFKLDFNSSTNLLLFIVSTFSLFSLTRSLLRITGGYYGRHIHKSEKEQQNIDESEKLISDETKKCVNKSSSSEDDIVTMKIDADDSKIYVEDESHTMESPKLESNDFETEKTKDSINDNVVTSGANITTEEENEVVLVSTTSDTDVPIVESRKIETNQSLLEPPQDMEIVAMAEDSTLSKNEISQVEDSVVEDDIQRAESKEEDPMTKKDETATVATDSTTTIESSSKLKSPESSLSLESHVVMKEIDFEERNDDTPSLQSSDPSTNDQSAVSPKTAAKAKRRTFFGRMKKKTKSKS